MAASSSGRSAVYLAMILAGKSNEKHVPGTLLLLCNRAAFTNHGSSRIPRELDSDEDTCSVRLRQVSTPSRLSVSARCPLASALDMFAEPIDADRENWPCNVPSRCVALSSARSVA